MANVQKLHKWVVRRISRQIQVNLQIRSMFPSNPLNFWPFPDSPNGPSFEAHGVSDPEPNRCIRWGHPPRVPSAMPPIPPLFSQTIPIRPERRVPWRKRQFWKNNILYFLTEDIANLIWSDPRPNIVSRTTAEFTGVFMILVKLALLCGSELIQYWFCEIRTNDRELP